VVGAPCLILDVEMELLQLCGPLLMAVILQFVSCLHELQRLMISVDDFRYLWRLNDFGRYFKIFLRRLREAQD
jgi:hypothetical protein